MEPGLSEEPVGPGLVLELWLGSGFAGVGRTGGAGVPPPTVSCTPAGLTGGAWALVMELLQ